MITKQSGLVVEKINKAYDFEGKSGISKKVRILVATDIFKCPVTDEQLAMLEDGKSYLFTFDVKTRVEVPYVTIISVEKK